MRRVGWSEFASFRRCHQQQAWRRLRRDEHVPVIRSEGRERGRLIQAVVEAFYKEEHWRDPNPLQRMYAALGTAAQATPPALMSQVTAVADLLPKVLETMQREELVGVEAWAEQKVSLVVEDVSIEGTYDLRVRAVNGTTKLLEGKTGWVERDQLRFYATALWVAGTPPDYVGIWQYRKGEVQWMKFTPKQRAAFLRSLEASMREYKAGLDDPRVGSHCQYCSFTHSCEPYRQSIRDKQARAPEIPDGGGFVSI